MVAELLPPMTRETFEKSITAISDLLSPAAFDLSREVYDPGAFGSAYADWVRRNERVRLVWDGRDRALILESSESGHLIDQLNIETETQLDDVLQNVLAVLAQAYTNE